MQSITFSAKDIPLLLIVCECLVLAIVLLTYPSKKRINNYLLAGFMLLSALDSIDSLVLWTEPFQRLTLNVSPNIAFIGGFAFWLQGPCLYFYCKSMMYSDFRLRKQDLWHLLPFLLYGIYMVLIYYRLDTGDKLAILAKPEQLYSSLLNTAMSIRHAVLVAYCIACLLSIRGYRRKIEHHFSNIEKISLNWLKLLIYGFLVTVLWGWLTHESMPGNDAMGTVWNYLLFFLVNAIVFYSLRHSEVFDGIMEKPYQDSQHDSQTDQVHPKTGILQEDIDKVQSAMEQDKLYLIPELTVEECADRLSMHPKTLSAIINQHYKRNFFDFINRYRVEHAKKLINNPQYRSGAILDVMHDSGFNSKSAFNRFFKKFSGMTPSQYRTSIRPGSQNDR